MGELCTFLIQSLVTNTTSLSPGSTEAAVSLGLIIHFSKN